MRFISVKVDQVIAVLRQIARKIDVLTTAVRENTAAVRDTNKPIEFHMDPVTTPEDRHRTNRAL